MINFNSLPAPLPQDIESYMISGEWDTAREMIEERFPHLKGKIRIYPIGPTIGCHTGPGTLVVFFFGKERTE